MRRPKFSKQQVAFLLRLAADLSPDGAEDLNAYG